MVNKKSYCFTLNNYTEDEYRSLVRVCETESGYAILGKEVGESGTPHIQGYIRFTKPYRFSTIKDRYLPRCHIEVAAGDAAQNRAYCSKAGDFREFGTPQDTGGNKSRDESARRFVSCMERRGDGGVAEFADEQPGVWYFSGHNLLRNYMTLQVAIPRPNINVKWFYGPPGSGKSRRAHDDLPNAYVKDPRTKWWNGYMLESTVIIDDFGPGGIDINHLLRWFDRYKCYVENKGGMLPLLADTFIVTSNFHPRDLFKDDKKMYCITSNSYLYVDHPQLPALIRRIELIEFYIKCQKKPPVDRGKERKKNKMGPPTLRVNQALA